MLGNGVLRLKLKSGMDSRSWLSAVLPWSCWSVCSAAADGQRPPQGLGQLIGFRADGNGVVALNAPIVYKFQQGLVGGHHAVETAAFRFLHLIQRPALDVVLAGVRIDQDVVVSGTTAIGRLDQPLGDHTEK